MIAQRDPRNPNASVITAVAAGETFVVTRNGTPVAELRPVTPGRRTFVAKVYLAALSARGPPIDAATFRRVGIGAARADGRMFAQAFANSPGTLGCM